MSKGLFVGRFQPFHNGHKYLIEKALEEVDELIIGIGSSQFGYTKNNPFTFEERAMMIDEQLKGNYKIFPIPDINDYPRWVSHVEDIVGEFDIVYAGRGSDITQKCFREKGYNIRYVDDEIKISATEIRNMMASDNGWKKHLPESTNKIISDKKGIERMKYLFDNYKYDKPSFTVDGIIKYDDQIVFIERGMGPYKGKLAFPGGHVDPFENPEEAIKREILEETGLDFNIKGKLEKVFCEKDRDPRGWTVSLVYYGEGIGELEAGDDAAKVILVPLEKALKEKLAFDHINMLRNYFNQVKNNG